MVQRSHPRELSTRANEVFRSSPSRRWGPDRATDRWVGHDYPGMVGSGMHDFTLDEMELGCRVAMAFGDPEQAWWEIHAEQIHRQLQGSVEGRHQQGQDPEEKPQRD